jgi:uncharacterized Zn-binding protein involved in type VI secretion
MSNAIRKNDMDSGHDGYPPRSILTGSLNVFINGSPAVTVGGSFGNHSKDSIVMIDGIPTILTETHSGAVSSGSPNVFVNGKPKARKGDSVSCGGTLVGGSGNVNVN